MLLVDLISWWYFRGWGIYFADLKRKLSDTVDTFSIGEMFLTLFKPYKQIAASSAGTGGSEVVDKLISRLVGFFARLTIIIAGTAALILEAVFGLLLAVIWPVAPVLPIIGVVLMIVGVTF